MGIKFNCPNGHKLNVKSFLSGKRAVCPKCGVGLVVPSLEETPAAGGDAEATGSVSTADIALVSASGDANVALRPSATGAGPGATTPTERGPTERGPTERGPTSPGPVDAIVEAPSAVWYVRPVSGGQFGPASADIMRAWLNDGRVGASSLVWRAGWPEWRAAATVFPQLAGMSAVPASGMAPAQFGPPNLPAVNGPPPIGGSLPTGHVVQSIPTEQPPGSPAGLAKDMPPLAVSVRRRRRANDKRLYASAVLVVVSIILLIVLFIVIPRNDKPADSPTDEATPPADASKQPEDPLGL